MAYVIGQTCIGTKDTACIDVCPTDSIHGYEESPQLYIDPATCIDCDACAVACPVDAIYPGDQVPAAEEKFIKINADFYNDWDRSKSIAAGKSEESNEAEAAEAGGGTDLQDATWTEAENWQAEWEAHKNDLEDPVERLKRYGRVRSLFETPDKYIVRLYLAEKTPNHPLVYQYDLPKEITKYEVEAETIGNSRVQIRGKLWDPKLRKLTGLVNSFPDAFVVDLPFEEEVESASVQVKTQRIVDVVVTKRNKKKLRRAHLRFSFLLIPIAFFMFACGEDATSLTASNVLGLPSGDKEGTGLAGLFTVRLEQTSNGCKDVPTLGVVPKGTVQSVEVEVKHEAGDISFLNIHVPLHGGVNFDNTFLVGGAETISRGGQTENILRTVRMEGDFQKPEEFSAKGRQRFTGSFQGSDIDCTVSFKADGLRQDQETSEE